MTLIAGAFGSAIAMFVALFAWNVTEVASHRARLQAAADAVALAAVAESGPYGSGDPRGVALKFAELNHVTLETCVCAPGASASQVTVTDDGMRASARAVIEVDALRPRDEARGLDPTLAAAVSTLVERSGGAVWVTSGFRSYAQQSELWAEALRRYGDAETADDWVAPPGSSMHERGLAVDLGGDLDVALRLIRELGFPFYRPLANEPWHFELVGSRADHRG